MGAVCTELGHFDGWPFPLHHSKAECIPFEQFTRNRRGLLYNPG
jgi:hypothetical protein